MQYNNAPKYFSRFCIRYTGIEVFVSIKVLTLAVTVGFKYLTFNSSPSLGWTETVPDGSNHNEKQEKHYAFYDKYFLEYIFNIKLVTVHKYIDLNAF